MILVIDNYDSFTYNLVQYLGEMGERIEVVRNDAISVEGVQRKRPDHIVISPGPGGPEDAGISVEVVRRLGPKVPILGVCLGHQCIGAAYGAIIGPAKTLMHGKTSHVIHDGKGILRGIDNPFEATRYHSLVVRRTKLPACLEVTAWTADKEIMGLQHREHLVWGVQFHPESILTVRGKRILRNFLDIA
ncbi:MAG: aminodeoxychorismate/anthranilate synthase component II [Candidatus Latescibacterota bacterium]|nr:MAG: aminodeoxychorismate/anthranilate synthase component II [Candidatus Latescibacterota bacterium]